MLSMTCCNCRHPMLPLIFICFAKEFILGGRLKFKVFINPLLLYLRLRVSMLMLMRKHVHNTRTY